MRRVYFDTWGHTRDIPRAQYALAEEYESGSEAVARSIERTSGYYVCGGPRLDSSTPTADIFEVTLGRLLPGDGFRPVCQVFFSIEVT